MDVQQLFKNLRKEVECPLCLETVKEPKTLPCLHSFCLKCLDKHVEYGRRRRETKIKCPVCLTDFKIPKSDTFSDLPTAFHLNRLVDVLALNDGDAATQTCNSCDENSAVNSYCFVCQSFLCAACLEAHQRLKVTRGHRNVLIEKLQAQDVEELMRRPAMCAQKYHQNEALEYYCQDCKVCVCVKCGFVSHNGHAMAHIEEAAAECTNKITEVVRKAKAQVAILETQTKRQTELMNKSVTEMYDAQAKATETVDELVKILREHEKAIKTELKRRMETQQRNHQVQLGVFQLAISQLKSCVERGEGVVQRNVPADILQAEQTIIGRSEELLNEAEIKIFKPDHFYYVPNAETLNVVKSLGSDGMFVSSTDTSSSTVADGESMAESVKLGGEIHFHITTRDSLGDQIYHRNDQVTVEVYNPLGYCDTAKIIDHKDGRYEVRYTPKETGRIELAIYINEKLLAGSPWSVLVTTSIYSIAQCRKTGNMAVADYDNKKVLLYDSGLNYLRTIVDFEPDRRPRCVAFTNFFLASNIIVVHEDTSQFSKISVFTQRGFPVMGIGAEFVRNPCSVSVKNDGKIIVCDSGDRLIKLLSPDGTKLLNSFRANDDDASPWFALHHQKKYFVSYRTGQSVKVFNKNGVYLHDIGEFDAPAGLAVDKFSNLIACDSDAKSVQVLTLKGKFITSLTAGKYLKCPCSVLVTIDGDVLIAEVTSGLVFKFHHRDFGYQFHEKRYLIS